LDPGQLQIPFWGDDGCTGPSDVPPIWQPEFFGNMMVVNGQTWPFLDVEQRRYRFRLLNGCNSRFLILNFSGIPGVEVWQIGAEGGFLSQPVNVTALNGGQILMSPAERADIIVDFTNVPQGNYVLPNHGPDEPFGGGMPNIDFAPADPSSTGQVMEFRVGPAVSADMTTPPMFLQMPAIPPVNPAAPIRPVSLNEEESKTVKVIDDGSGNVVLACGNPTAEDFGPTAALLGTLNPDDTGNPLLWSDATTENPTVGSTETWEIHNFTADAHPIHIHLVQFQVVGREAIGGGPSIAGSNGPLPTENGYKDTVISYPGEITRVQARFDKAGLFVWHCHIVEHEDNEMMRPYRVL
jgi:spore coat protein A